MVGIPVDLLWLVPLDFSLGEKKSSKKKTKKTEKREREIWRPYNPWDELP